MPEYFLELIILALSELLKYEVVVETLGNKSRQELSNVEVVVNLKK